MTMHFDALLKSFILKENQYRIHGCKLNLTLSQFVHLFAVTTSSFFFGFFWHIYRLLWVS